MNTVPRVACQTCSGIGLRRAFLLPLAGLMAIGFWPAMRQAEGQAPAATRPGTSAPPAWQQELEAAHLLEASLDAAPVKDPAEASARDERMSALYRGLADKYPERAAVQKACGEYAWHHERAVEAAPFLRRAEALDPADADTADVLASTDLQLGRTKEAVSQWQQAVSDAPAESRYHFALANALFLFRHELLDPTTLPDEEAVFAKALEEFRQASALAPQNLSYAQAYAETFYVVPHPDWEQARSAWKTVLTLSGADTDFPNSHLARVSLRMKRPEEAEAYLALIHRPDFADLKAKLHAQAAKLPPAAP